MRAVITMRCQSVSAMGLPSLVGYSIPWCGLPGWKVAVAMAPDLLDPSALHRYHVRRRHSRHFLNRRRSAEHFPPAVLAQGAHAGFEGFQSNLVGVGALHDQLLDMVGVREQL